MRLDPRHLLGGIPDRVGEVGSFGRKAGATGRNVAEYLLTGGLVIEPEYSPFEVVAAAPMYRLRRYFPEDVRTGLPPIVLIPPLLIVCDVYDVAPRSSVVRSLHDNGMDAWVVDFGRPEEEPGGLGRTVADHVLAVSEVVDEVRRITGRDPILAGYSQGGLFAYQATAYRRGEGVDSIVALGAPVDYTAAPLPTPVVPVSAASYMHIAEGLVALGLLPKVTMPRWMGRHATRLTDPVSSVRFQLKYIAGLHDREALLPGEQQRQFLDRKGFTAYPGTAMLGLFEMIADNRALIGGLAIGDLAVTLADITCPILTIVGERDREGAAPSARAIDRAAPLAPVYELTLGTGHFGMVASSAASRNTWPRVAGWARWRNGDAELPVAILPATEVTSAKVWAPTPRGQKLQQVADVGIEASRVGLRAAAEVLGVAHGVLREHGRQVPIVNRLELVQPPSARTLASSVARAAQVAPDRVAYVANGRVVRNARFDQDVDRMASRLVSAGLRPGERLAIVGVGGSSALELLVAANRIGAAVVLPRPGADLEGDLARVDVRALVVGSDDPHEGLPAGIERWSLDREPEDGVLCLEASDAARPSLPGWYVPNPQGLEDTVLIAFDGHGPGGRTIEVDQRAWVSAGPRAATALDLGHGATVGVTDRWYDAGQLLHAVAGAFEAGSRLAILDDQSPERFWRDVRRAGVTHLAATGSSLAAVLEAARDPRETGQPIRTVFGGGIPASLCRRLEDRLPGVRVVDTYTPPDGSTLVAHTTAAPGVTSLITPRSGPDVEVVRLDFSQGTIDVDQHGLARRTAPDELGGLVVRVAADRPGQIVRNLFASDDAWVLSGDAFVRRAHGALDYCDRNQAIVEVAGRPVSPGRAARAVALLPEVERAVGYAADVGGLRGAVVDVQLAARAELSAWDLDHAFRTLDVTARPDRVRVVPAIAVDVLYRGLAAPDEEPLGCWTLDRSSGAYRSDPHEPQSRKNPAEGEVMTRDIHTVLGGYTYFEAPRWHDGRLWASDLYTHQVVSCAEDGTDVRVEATLDVPPAGLGWLPDGRLLITSTQDGRLLRREADGSLVVHADLSGLTRGWLNDFAVDNAGRVFIGHFGFDLFAGEPLKAGSIIRVDPDGSFEEVAGDVFFPNGSVITKDGRLLVGETFGNRVSAFTIQDDGKLTDRNTWAKFGELAETDDVFAVLGAMAVASDGCTIDDEGALWIADIAHGRVVRVREGGEILDEVQPGTGVFACALGGADGRTLFLCTAPDFDAQARTASREAEIRAVRVDVPGARPQA